MARDRSSFPPRRYVSVSGVLTLIESCANLAREQVGESATVTVNGQRKLATR